jgi:hypothetical protein
MDRLEFITLAGGAAVWLIAGHAQHPAIPMIGWLSSLSAVTNVLVLPVR